MAFKQGEVYKCPDPNCGCEITVTKGAAPVISGRIQLLFRRRAGDPTLDPARSWPVKSWAHRRLSAFRVTTSVWWAMTSKSKS